MKKVLIFLGIVVVLFALLAVLNEKSSAAKVEDNPYDKSLEELHPETVASLDDPNTSNNIITLNELEEKLSNKESVYVYFFSPACSHCKEFTPIIVPLAKEMGIDLKLLNVLEYEEAWERYNIEGTPTVYHFINGKQEGKMEGNQPEETIKEWFNANEEYKANIDTVTK